MLILVLLFIFQKRKLRLLRKNRLSCVFIVFSFLFISSCSNSSSKTHSPPLLSKIETSTKKRNSLYTSIDGGQTWVSSGNDLPSDLDVNCIERVGLELIIGTEQNGLFMSEGDRSSWKLLGENLPSKKIKNIEVIDEQNIIVTFSNGIFTTLDFGRSWIDMTYNLKDENVMDVLLFGENIFAGADNGIYELHNKNWRPVYQGQQVSCLKHLNGKLFAGTVKGLLQSNDDGTNWELTQTEGAIHNIVIVNWKILLMYINGDVYTSTDIGETWQKALYHQNHSSYVYEATAIGNSMLMSNNYGVHQSIDDGLTWQLIYNQRDEFFSDFLVVPNLIYGVTRENKN